MDMVETKMAVLPLVFLAAMMLLGGMVLVIILLRNPRTRVVGGILLTLGLVVPLLGVPLLLWVRVGEVERSRMEFQVAAMDRMASEEVATPSNGIISVETRKKEPAGSSPSDEPADGSAIPVEEPAAEKRPAWVDATPSRVGDTYQTCITVGPYTSRMECDARLPAALEAGVADYTEIFLGRDAAGRVRLPEDYVRKQIVKQEWEETIQASFGPMIQLHVQLEFDKQDRELIEKQWQQSIVAGRLWYTSLSVAGGLALMGLLFLGMKIDLATKGAFRGRLFFAAAATVMAVAVAAFILMMFFQAPMPAATKSIQVKDWESGNEVDVETSMPNTTEVRPSPAPAFPPSTDVP